MIVDLFAGPGGWSTGLNLIGRAETVGIEWDKAACDTARAAGHERLQADIAELDPHTIGGDHVEGLIASPPCQGFSMAGKGKGRLDALLLMHAAERMARGEQDLRDHLERNMKDTRSILALEPLRWALELEPEWMAWEQVPAVLPLWEACAEVLRADGYSVWTGLVQAEQYGVPQTRKRAILTATRNGIADRPVPTHSKYHARSKDKLDPGTLKWVSMAEALNVSGMHLRHNSGHRDRPRDTDTGKQIVRESDGSDYYLRFPTDAPAPSLTTQVGAWAWDNATSLDGMRWIPVAANEGTTADDMAWVHNRPSPTIIGSFAPDVVAAPGYRGPGDGPRQKAKGSVRVTVQEAGVLQSFPADYPWQGSKTAQYRQVGDAVPPLMAAHVLASIGVGQVTAEAAA